VIRHRATFCWFGSAGGGSQNRGLSIGDLPLLGLGDGGNLLKFGVDYVHPHEADEVFG
jgi:hypothetical protein